MSTTRPIPENLRFYYPSGEPCFEVDSADGKKKLSPTIAHVRKLGLVPSVTTILRETLASPTLVRWRERNAAEAMFAVLQGQPGLKHDEVMLAWADKLEEGSAAVIDPGKDVHAAIEKHYRGEEVPEERQPWVKTAVSALPPGDYVPEQVVPTTHGFGGRADLYLPSESLVVDIKTRSFSAADAEKGKVKPYESEAPQLAAYAAALGATRIANLFLSRDDPAVYVWREYSAEEQGEAWGNFKALLRVFRSLRGIQ